VTELEGMGLAAHDDLDVDGLPDGADVRMVFLDLADAEGSQAVVGINPLDVLAHELVDGITGKRNADLVVPGGKIALDKAEIACAATDIDEKGIGHGVDIARLAEAGVIAVTERGKKRLGNEEDAVEGAGRADADVFAGGLVGVGGNAHRRS